MIYRRDIKNGLVYLVFFIRENVDILNWMICPGSICKCVLEMDLAVIL